jgi:UDP-N-acetylglucosamine:LPS N-acetylglucosamine transferase
MWRSLKFIWRRKPDLVLGVAAVISIPLLIAGRLLGRDTVFVESLTRVTTPSLTARLCHDLRLARTLYVQWPELIDKLPRATYAGKVI